MPILEEHSKHSLKRYGERGEDIHKFLDEPVKIVGRNHREFRHDTETIELVGKLFGQKYGKAKAESIALDHIMLDHLGKIKVDCKIPVEKVKPFNDPIKVEPVKLDVGNTGTENNSLNVILQEMFKKDKPTERESKLIDLFLKTISSMLKYIRTGKPEGILADIDR
jgi:hypothetical protein